MKWADLRKTVTVKLHGTITPQKKHDVGFVNCGDQLVGKVLIGRHREMKPHEIGGCARSLRLSETRFKELVACTLSEQAFCELVFEDDQG